MKNHRRSKDTIFCFEHEFSIKLKRRTNQNLFPAENARKNKKAAFFAAFYSLVNIVSQIKVQ